MAALETPVACCAPLGAPALDEAEALATAELFKALGDPARVRIVNLLATSDGAVCACDLYEPLGLSQPTVSHHLKKLTDELREEVRRRYAESARAVSESSHDCGCGSGACCTPEQSEAEVKFGELLYDAEQRGELPDEAVLASLGCGNPTAVAELREGETVLDLGSGGGIDVILSAKRVGPSGTAYGLDMTDEMLALAMQNARDADVANVHFLKGVIEQISRE